MKFIDLFAGIGGFRYGLQKAARQTRSSIHCVWSNEWDRYASEVYKNHYGECDTRDIRTVITNEIPDHDLLCAGFPCQSFSIAGKRLGFEDTRGTMFFEIARIIQDKRPRYLLLENVKGLLSHNQGKTFQTILGVLTNLGYEYQWQVLNSKNFGVPQNRERLFIVGNLRRTCRPQVFPIRGEIPETTHSGDVAGTLQADYGKRDRTGGYVIKAQPVLTPERINKRQNGRRVKNEGEPMITLTGQDRHGVAVGTLRTHKDGNGFREIKQGGIAPTIPARARTDGSGQPVVIDDFSPNRVRGFEESPTLRSGRNGLKVSDNLRIRLLTPTECERLQGFPDGWTEGVSDTQRYKQLGNAVTTNVVTEIGKRLLKVVNKSERRRNEYEARTKRTKA